MQCLRARGFCRLLFAFTAIATVWTIVLPRVSRLPAVRSRIVWMEQHNVDPSALFYTEIDVLSEKTEHVATVVIDHPSAFWHLNDRRTGGSK